jgi:hypothetical protein
MVLIDDGALDSVGDAVLVSDVTPAPPATHSFEGMVLLPDPGAGRPATDEIASRAEGAHGASLRPAPND